MKAFVEWSSITRHYYVRLETRRAEPLRAFDADGSIPERGRAGGYEWTSRKANAERAARLAGATEVVHVERDTVRDLERHLGMTHATALEVAREWFR